MCAALAVALARDGDRMALDAVNAIEVASRESATGKAAVLARAHQMFREGRRLFEESRFKEAESLFQEAGRQLQRSGSRFEIEASYFAARGAYRQQRIDEALAGLAPLIDAATSRGYWYLAARLRRVRGVIEESRSQLAAALEDYRVAATHYERIHDAESAAGVHNLLAEHLQTLGEPRESWSELFRALSLLGASRRRFSATRSCGWRLKSACTMICLTSHCISRQRFSTTLVSGRTARQLE
jgi:tetratricopeptide (TPR) repeat protein